ncbi:unnamed protein product [Calypogeia fissa]
MGRRSADQHQSMKREGRIHGFNVRVGKRAWGDGGYRGKIAFNKPTNESKSAIKHPVPVVAQAVYNEHELPAQKSFGKTKNAFKAKDLDITRNHLMQDWSIYKGGLPVDEDYDDEGSDDVYLYHREQWTNDEYGNGGHEDEEVDEDEDEEHNNEQEHEEDAYWDADSRARSQMVLPIESLLTASKRKIAPSKANAVQQRRQQQQLTLTDAVGVAEIVVERTAPAAATAGDDDDGNNIDQFESWWGLGFYDEEEVPDDWFLITEEEDFLVPA